MKKTKQTIASMLLTALLLSTLACTLVVQPVRASGFIYIRSDGSIDPPGAPILRNGDLYTLTSNTSSSIIVERDNIIVDGVDYIVQGSTIGNGIDLNGRSNVTIRNINVRGFESGVYISATSHSTILASNITDNDEGISSYESSDNAILGNNISANVYEGIYLYSSSNNNTVSGNNISANVFDGIYLYSSSDNSISGNNIAGNGYGISPYYSSGNRIFHNNFVNNTFPVNPNSPLDIWDNGYPSGGNYWDDYVGVDAKNGPSQDHLGSDGIGDTHYAIDTANIDNYPLMDTWTPPDIAATNLTTSKTVVGQGYTLLLNGTFLNQGNKVEGFTVSFYANSTAIASQPVILLMGNSIAIPFVWNTTGFAYGNYTISAVATLPSDTDPADNTFVDGKILVTITGDINGDQFVNSKDAVILGVAFGSKRGDIKYTPNADINDDGYVNAKDAVILGTYFGQHWS